MCGSASCWCVLCVLLSMCMCVWSASSADIPSCFPGSLLTLLVHLLFLTEAALTVIPTNTLPRLFTWPPGEQKPTFLSHTHLPVSDDRDAATTKRGQGQNKNTHTHTITMGQVRNEDRQTGK